MSEFLDRLGGWLSQLHMETKIKEGLTKEQISCLSQLADACQSLVDHIDKLKSVISVVASGQRAVITGECQSDTMATLRACQILKSCIDFMRPPKTESEGLFKALSKLSQVSKGPSGFELVSFPMMRKQVPLLPRTTNRYKISQKNNSFHCILCLNAFLCLFLLT